MKIIITTTNVPFVVGGAEFLAQNLKTAIEEYGHEAAIVTMPFMDHPLYRIEDHIVAARLMDVEWSWGGHVDLCIGLKFPAYLMPHPNKVIWALHQHRQAYELFDTEFGNIHDDPEGNRARKVVMNADRAYLAEAKAIYTISRNVSDRMKRYSEIDSVPLYHPCPDMEQFRCDCYGDYILMPSRINPSKRQELAIEALSHTRADVSLCIVGKADNETVRKNFMDRIRSAGLENRVHYLDYVDQEEKIRLYAEAKAVLFIPKDEDYGYISLEAMSAAKAVVTVSDSGGPLEFIEDGRTGIVADPAPDAIASAMDRLYENEGLAEQMGQEAKRRIHAMGISWEKVVKELTK